MHGLSHFLQKEKTGKLPVFSQLLAQQPQPLSPPGRTFGGKKSSSGNSTASKTLHGSSLQHSPPASVHSFDGMQ